MKLNKKKYSNFSYLKYFFKLFENIDNKNFFIKKFDYQKDLALLFSNSSEDFWANLNVKKISEKKYKKNCNKIDKYIFDSYPIPYLNKKCFFYNIPLFVKKGVFIPQFDTEILVEKTLILIKKIWGCKNDIKMLEIGTGTGNISIFFAKDNLNWSLTSLDISKKSLSVAKFNSDSLKIRNINFILSNVFSNLDSNFRFDVLISNPPYVSFDEYKNLSEYTKKQPKKSLVAKKNGYWFYHEIISKSKKFINSKFLVIFEIGNNQSDGVKKILFKYFFKIKFEIFKDLSGNDRVFAFYNLE